METTKKYFDPRPDLRGGPWLMGAWVEGQSYFENMFTPLLYVQNDQRVMEIILR